MGSRLVNGRRLGNKQASAKNMFSSRILEFRIFPRFLNCIFWGISFLSLTQLVHEHTPCQPNLFRSQNALFGGMVCPLPPPPCVNYIFFILWRVKAKGKEPPLVGVWASGIYGGRSVSRWVVNIYQMHICIPVQTIARRHYFLGALKSL